MQFVARFQVIAFSLLAAILFANIGCSTTTAEKPPTEVSALATAMIRRLAIADQVAWVKYQSGAPVLDVAREQQVLERVVSAAQAVGLDPQLATRFFEAQMLASRTRQQQLITDWSRGGLLPTWGPLSLKDDIRPVLDQLTTELIDALKEFPDSTHSRNALAATLREAGYTNSVVHAATQF
ncbi:MAG: gamma subclass chorismate mutase AroQ [Chthoniobacterales bacterium]